MHLGDSGGETVLKQEQKKSLSIFALLIPEEAMVSPCDSVGIDFWFLFKTFTVFQNDLGSLGFN